MSYSIDFDDLYEKLFLLQQIAIASEKYCEQEMTGSELDIGEGAFDIYWGWVKGIISNHLIDCAIKTRIMQEYLTEIKSQLDLGEIDLEIRKNLNIGIIHMGNFELTLRESCNKIIHATKSTPSWVEKTAADKTFKYWNGLFNLYGARGNQKWHI